MDRQLLYDICKGFGVEIGPGPRPQIKPGADVDVVYVEEKNVEEWIQLYNGKGIEIDPACWNRYVIGNASNLPVKDSSCDFIFSSHVFEHLANPLGHLRYWAGKLKPGGKVVAVIPDIFGCRDYVYTPTELPELIEEFNCKSTVVSRRHYERWAQQKPGFNVERALTQAESIHVHFYSPRNIMTLLEYVKHKRWFAESEVIWKPNHKDFYIVLRKE